VTPAPQPREADRAEGRQGGRDPDPGELRERVERLASGGGNDPAEAREVVRMLLRALSEGIVRSAEHGPDGWRAVEWVKAGILLAFRTGETRRFDAFALAANEAFSGSTLEFYDRDTLPLWHARSLEENVRIVPGGSSVRAGAFLGRNVVLMPPAFVNIGAYVDEGTMIDSHALVGSCAQVGKRVHLSAGAQLGGVLEPVGLRPVIVEDDALIAGNVGVFEGTLIGRRVVIAPGVQLTRSTAVYDLVRGEVHRATAEVPLSIPEGAVVVPGARPANGDFAREHGLQLYTPVIVKYRDEKTDASAALESALR
jgi:2,3,4,5-tetrahydropyridine-2,6-dicarboxylate N-succinyltransferase